MHFEKLTHVGLSLGKGAKRGTEVFLADEEEAHGNKTPRMYLLVPAFF